MYKKIVVPVDGSDAALAALEISTRLLDADGGSLVLLHVIPDGGLPEGLKEWAEMEYASQPPVWRYNEDVGERIIEGAVGQARDLGCTRLERRVARGDPASKIVEQAKAVSADAIVIGTRGLSALKSLVVGSVAQKVLHNAPCAVVAVH